MTEEDRRILREALAMLSGRAADEAQHFRHDGEYEAAEARQRKAARARELSEELTR